MEEKPETAEERYWDAYFRGNRARFIGLLGLAAVAGSEIIPDDTTIGDLAAKGLFGAGVALVASYAWNRPTAMRDEVRASRELQNETSNTETQT